MEALTEAIRDFEDVGDRGQLERIRFMGECLEEARPLVAAFEITLALNTAAVAACGAWYQRAVELGFERNSLPSMELHDHMEVRETLRLRLRERLLTMTLAEYDALTAYQHREIDNSPAWYHPRFDFRSGACPGGWKTST